MKVQSSADPSAISETYDDVRNLLTTASWEVMDEDQRDDVIAKVVLPRWGKLTADGVSLKGTAWAKLLGTTMATIETRVRRLRATEQEESASATNGPQPNQRASIRSAKASIKKHPELARTLLNDPDVRKAATDALVDSSDVGALSQATAKAAKNRQVERNRARVAAGLGKGRSVSDPKPAPADPVVAAWMSVRSLPDALRALVTTFPQEWAALPEAARIDEDFVAFCEETVDKLEIALAAVRTLISGGSQVEHELQALLDGGE